MVYHLINYFIHLLSILNEIMRLYYLSFQISHVIREIRHFQQTPYKIELVTKVTNYLLDTSLLLNEKDLYRISLDLEPRTSRLSSSTLIDLPPSVSHVSTK